MRRIAKSVGHASRGLVMAFREEMNIKIHVIISLVVIAAGIYFNISATEWLVLILTIVLVMSLEIINSILERVIDIIKPSVNQYVKEMKDMIAGSVLLAAIAAVVVGLIIFVPKILGQ
jgi:diacylglycerol kinase